ncbi:nucleolar protein dao-5 [Frankliniella occidentalis]|uniref:Nucleolar protein dao-5 n=1 Tax=Frankliniella occidentalis TaxID=133901 RepID=A0A6J1SML4_FRAOC|nr:nucleolar protein dao-5 [Frankliniella occidentalis]
MPAAIPWGENEIEKLASSSDSRIYLVHEKIPVVLQPFHLQDLKSAVRDLLNTSIGSYHKSLNGIILSYKHLKVISKSASVAAETSGVVVTIQADFFVFRPEVGNVLKGIVNKISKDHVGVLLYQRFNISCPRPSSESRSEKWLGNQVSMQQEVTFKVKEANFSGTLPFLKGKLLSVGDIVTAKIEEDKKPKKKKKEKTEDESYMPEQSSCFVTSVSKDRKHKLVDLKDSGESKAKKAKKVIQFEEDTSKSVLECSNAVESTKELPVIKKKKRVSLGIEADFIPRLSLDVSQLPEDLPPPNADSTHFDVAKNLSSLNRSEKKKRRKETNAGLSDIREESSEITKSLQNVHFVLDNSNKSPHTAEEKLKKKKEKKEKKQKNDSLQLSEVVSKVIVSPKKLKVQSSKPINPLSQVEASSKDISDSSRKKKKKLSESDFDLKTEDRQENAVTNSKSLSLAQSSIGETSSPKKKKLKDSESKGLFSEPFPVKEKKAKKDKKADVSVPSDSQENKIKFGTGTGDSQTLSQSKKKLDEIPKNLSPVKKSKKRKERDVLDNSLEIGSDDTIPPGQRLVSESPLKRVSKSPERRQSLSFSLGYFPPSSGMDLDLGPMRGARRAPLMFGDLEKKILAPEMSPEKISPTKKGKNDSDSDTPKKVVVSTSVSRKRSESDDSDSDDYQPTAKSPQKSFLSSRKAEDSSADSDSDNALKSKLLQSMGVMQSPLKTAKPNLKHDTSDSESERSIDEHRGNMSKLGKSFNNATPNNAKKSSKPISADKIKESPKKSTRDITKSTPVKGKVALAPTTQAVNGDSDDSDLELMKSTIAIMEEEKRLGIKGKAKVTPKKKGPNAKKKTGVNTSDAPAVPIPTPRKKKNSKEKIETVASDTLVNSHAVTSQKKTVKTENVPVKPVTGDSVSNKVTKTSPNKKKLESVQAKINYSDSDSGPDDRNTSDFLIDMRNKRQAAEAEKSTKSSAKSKKKSGVKEISQPVNNTKPKKQKISGHSTESTDKESNLKKPKSKGKKKSTDDEISDVMQRLLREAKINVGLA